MIEFQNEYPIFFCSILLENTAKRIKTLKSLIVLNRKKYLNSFIFSKTYSFFREFNSLQNQYMGCIILLNILSLCLNDPADPDGKIVIFSNFL